MFATPLFFAPTAVCARLLNALLRREEWAAQRLSRHSGKTVRFTLGRLTLNVAVQMGGFIEPSDPAVIPDVTLTIPVDKLGRLPQALRSADPEQLTSMLHVQGDAGLATVISGLARDLRWDVEDDLAELVGDVAARRILKGLKSLAHGFFASAKHLEDNIGEYLSEESRLVLARPAFEQWMLELRVGLLRLDALEDSMAVLQRRPAGKG